MALPTKYSEEHLVSIYLTNHNYEKYIKQSIDSVLGQTYKNFELIVIDDGSTDESKSVIEQYRDNPKIKIVYQENKGLNVTNNIALRMATGEYIMRLDADDYLRNDFLELMVAKIESGNYGLVFPDYYTVDEFGNPLKHMQRHDFDQDVTLYDQPAHGACTLFRRSCLMEVNGYDTEFQCQDGYDIWLKVIRKYEITNINEPLFYYRQHSTSLTKNDERILETRHRIVRKAISALDISSRNHLVVIPIRGMERNNPLALERVLGKSLIELALESIDQSENIDNVVISTPDTRIIDYCFQNELSSRYKKNLIIDSRPKELASFNSHIENTINYLLQTYKKEIGSPETVSFYSVATPLRKPRYLDQAINTLYLFEADCVLGTIQESSTFYRHVGSGLQAVNDGVDQVLTLERDYIYRGLTGFWTAKTSNIINHNNFAHGKVSHIIVDKKSSFSVGSEYDLKIANFIANEFTRH